MAKTAGIRKWHNIGKTPGVKKAITYRAITVAIGILVAMVIALTLWSRPPRETSLIGLPAGASAKAGLPAEAPSLLHTAKKLLKATTSLYFSSPLRVK